MRLPAAGALLLTLFLSACPSRAPEAEAEPPVDPPPAPEAAPPRLPALPIAPDDDPLPAPDEVPAFLAPRFPAGAPGSAEAGGAGQAPDAKRGSLGYLFVGPEEEVEPPDPPPAEAEAEAETIPAAPVGQEDGAGPQDAARPFGAEEAAAETKDAPSPEKAEPAPAAPSTEAACQPLREAIARHQAYLHRIHDERRAFGWVEDSEDAAALRLLEGLRRCEAHPDDPDCRPPPLEADLAERTLEPHVYSRDPSDVNAEGREPDEIPHDPMMLDLLERLRRCEAARRTPPPRP